MKNIRNHIFLLTVFLLFILVVPSTSAKIVANTGSAVYSGEQVIINRSAPGEPESKALPEASDNDGILDPLDVSLLETGSKIGVFRNGEWKLDYNNDGVTDYSFYFGTSTDIPITGDWNGDGITESGVFRPSAQQFILNTSPITRITFGLNTDVPITGDWNGDGITDIGVFRPSARQFILNTSPITRIPFGLSTDIPVTGDWNGDGSTDAGVFRPSTRQFILNTVPITRITYGLSTDKPVTGKWIQTTYKVYAEVGEWSLVDSARGFWDNIRSGQYGGIRWADSGRGLLVKPSGPPSCTGDSCPRAIHWTSDASQWIGQADFLFYSGHGFPEGLAFTDDYGNNAYSTNMGLNSTGRVKWAVLDACSALNGDGDGWQTWALSFNKGLHMLLGWHTDVSPSNDDYSNYRGEAFAELLKGTYPGNPTLYTIRDAWWLAGWCTYQRHPGHSSFDIYNAVMYWNNCGNDYLPGYGDICTNPGVTETIIWEPRLVFAKNTAGRTNSLPMNLTAENFSLIASFPIAGNNTMIYVPLKSGYAKEWVSSLAKNLGMSGDIRETEDSFYAGDKDKEQFLFVVQKNSSMILFRNNNRSFNGISDALQSDNQSISVANTFLQENNLLPSKNPEPRVVNITAVSFSGTGERIGERKTYIVIYPQLIDGLPVFNAQFNVEVDSDGNIIGFTRNWREYESFKEISPKSPEDAFSEFRIISTQNFKGLPEKVTVTKVLLGYQINQSGVSEYLEPVYIFEGDIYNENSTDPFEPVVIAANKEGVQDALIPLTSNYKPEVMNKISGNFSAPVSNTIAAQNTLG